MDSVCLIIRDVIPNEAAQMILIEGDYVVEQLSATASNPTFRDWQCGQPDAPSAWIFHAASMKGRPPADAQAFFELWLPHSVVPSSCSSIEKG